ncbi:MAG TPA: signal peptidase II [Clostridiales bacterium]|nr:signal peptidase II [Clostridiales bacterium]
MIFILLILAIVCVEKKIKDYIESNKQYGDEKEILDGKIIINKHHNYGMMLNFLEDKKELALMIPSICLGGLLIIFAIVLTKKRSFLLKLGFSFLLGGAISNIHDRVKRGYVVDYFSINKGKELKRLVFNIADVFIFVGTIIIGIVSFFKLFSSEDSVERINKSEINF